MKSDVCLVTTFHRNELLYCCLKRIREYEPNLQIEVFPDRGTLPDVQAICDKFGAHGHLCPDSHWYGNTRCAMDSLLWAYNAGFERVFFVEGDVIAHPDLFSWYRRIFEDYEEENPFCALGWVFNRHAPLVDCDLTQPWFYAPSFAIERAALHSVIQYSTPLYYQDMPGFVREHFKDSPLNDPMDIAHWEFDGLIQRIIDKQKRFTISPGIAKCSHMGFVRSYGDEGAAMGYEELFRDTPNTFEARVERIEQLIADPYERVAYFGREIVERELGRVIPERSFRYRVTLRNGFSTEFSSPLSKAKLPMMIHSAPIPPDARIEQL